MRLRKYFNWGNYTLLIILFLISYFSGYSQVTQVNILGGAQVSQGQTITIAAGSSLSFRITNVDTDCEQKLKIKDIIISNTTDFSISPNKRKKKIYPSCNDEENRAKYFDFTVTAKNITSCGTYSTLVTIKTKSGDFSFTVEISTSSEIYVLGGNPFSEIFNGATTTSSTNGTFFGVVDVGSSVTRRFAIANIGNCPLDVTSINSSNADFVISSPYTIPFYGINPYYYIVFDVTFTGPVAGTGAQTSIISIANNDIANNPFTFTVSAEMFNYNIPGPGGVTADFRLWLKSTRGISVTSGSSVATWEDIGTNGKNAIQSTAVNQPTYYDDVAHNLNFNPVLEFQNDGASIEQYLYNADNGFYSQDIYMIVVPNETINSSISKRTIFSGHDSGSVGDLTGIGFGNYTTRFTGEILTYGQDVESPTGTFYGIADTSGSQDYSKQAIINIRNNAAGNGMEYLFNGATISTSEVNDNPPFSNVGYTNPGPPATILGTPYKIGKNFDIQGSFNGSVAEIMTFADRVLDSDRPKIETYLALKYGITLGVNGTSQNYVLSDNTVVWDVTANAGFNYNIAGIARDSISDLNQKQSKSIKDINEVTIGLGGIFDKNSDNPNHFKSDKQALVWGCNNSALTGTATATVTIASGLTSTLTRIDRKWKIVETGIDIENTYLAIPTTAFSSFSKNANEEYVLIVADNANFSDADIIDVVPLKIKLDALGSPELDKNGNQLYYTWYDFETTKYFTFGKISQITGNRAVNIAAGDYLVGEYDLNLNVDSFTISAWVKSSPSASNRTIMAKGAKLQMRLNSTNKVEVFVDTASPTFTSQMAINDSKWHQVTFVYNSGTILLYIDGIVDSSIQDIVHPSPNYNRFSIGALYISEANIVNPFLGDIDEAYVWDFALSESQIRYLMNQETEKITGDLVSGKILPYSATSNELVSIPWSDLRAYYDFNSFYGSTIEGKTDDRYFLRINYLKKDKTVVTSQTAPLPYTSKADGAWDTPGTWLNNADQMLPNTIGLDGTTSIDWNIVETTHNINSGDRDIAVLGYKMDAGKLTVANPNNTLDETNPGHGLFISHYFELDGVLDLVGESQLVQQEGSILDEDSGGYILKDEQGTGSSYNYNDWSLSVGAINGNTATRGTGVASTNASTTIESVLFDGTNSSNPKPITFSSSYNVADGAATSPITISTYWMYTFNGADNDYNAWNKIDEKTPLLPGEGFTMKGSSGASAVSDSQNYVFKGKPYNGDFTLPIAAGNDRLVGNPYPSAMDANEFILDNIKDTINLEEGQNTVNVFNGALYFWHHFAKSTHNLADYQGGYATYTLMGGTQAYASDTRINATGAAGNKIPERYIPVNQGFFVVAALDASIDSTTTTVDGGNIVFKNSQRVFVRKGYTGTNTGSLFFKSNVKKNKQKSIKIVDQRAKIRLDFSSNRGYHRQLLLGADAHASKNFDIGYDALLADLNEDDMFWNLNGAKMVIQAVNSFTDSEEIPIGIKLKEDGLISIKIDSLENLDSQVEIFIKDAETNQISPINNFPFQINLLAGEYLDRFSLTFKAKVVDTPIKIVKSESSIQVFMNNKISELQIINTNNTKIVDINVFNYLGQRIKTWNSNLNLNRFGLPLKAASGVYVVQINTTKGMISKKIIIN
jgi:hypothetical protein